MITIKGQNLTPKRTSYPIRVKQDTTYVECNFSQVNPHTSIFTVDPGVLVRFENCNLRNVTAPDGAEMIACQNAQVVGTDTATGTKNLLHECTTCATFVAVLRQSVASGDYKTHLRLDLLKPLAASRRLDAATATADLNAVKAENTAALAAAGGVAVGGAK